MKFLTMIIVSLTLVIISSCGNSGTGTGTAAPLQLSKPVVD